jgi:hypothetical protein
LLKVGTWERTPMPLIRLLQNSAFDPEMISVMSAAFQQACQELGLAETEDPLREIVARKIIECAQTGERDQARLCDCALKAIRA